MLFLLGFILASQTQSLAMLYLGFGVLGGFASGLAYNAVMSTMSKWFPDKQGLISGILLMGFGIGSFIIGKVYSALTPAEIGGWRKSFFVLAIILFAVLLIGGFFFVKPGRDFVPPAGTKTKKKNREEGIDINAGLMLRRPSFWLFFVWAILLSAAGLALISQAGGVASEVAPEQSAGAIATVVGLISVFNGIGRVLFGALFDKLGRFRTMILVNSCFLVSVIIVIVGLTTSSFWVLTLSFACCGLSYGGITPTNSAFINSFYGLANYPVNFSVVNLNLLIASFGSTIAGALYDSSGSYLSTFYMMIGAILAGTVCSCLIRKP